MLELPLLIGDLGALLLSRHDDVLIASIKAVGNVDVDVFLVVSMLRTAKILSNVNVLALVKRSKIDFQTTRAIGDKQRSVDISEAESKK